LTMEGIDPSKRLSDLRRELPKPAFLVSPEELLDSRQYSYFITEHRDFDGLPDDVKSCTKVRIKGKNGHRACTVFTVEKVTTESLYGNLCGLNGNLGLGLRGYMK